MRFFILPSITIFLGMFFAAWNYEFFYIIAHPLMKKKFFLQEITRTEKKITFFSPSRAQERPMLAYPLMIPWENKNDIKTSIDILKKSYELIKKAIKNNENTGWYAEIE